MGSQTMQESGSSPSPPCLVSGFTLVHALVCGSSPWCLNMENVWLGQEEGEGRGSEQLQPGLGSSAGDPGGVGRRCLVDQTRR